MTKKPLNKENVLTYQIVVHVVTMSIKQLIRGILARKKTEKTFTIVTIVKLVFDVLLLR